MSTSMVPSSVCEEQPIEKHVTLGQLLSLDSKLTWGCMTSCIKHLKLIGLVFQTLNLYTIKTVT